MSEAVRRRTGLAVLLLLLAAAALRLFVFSQSLPHNAYDDHLEAVAYYATHGTRPAADACWQCYQPPAYYELASRVLRTVSAAVGDNVRAWRAVQILSVLFSLGTLALTARILALAGSRLPGPRLCALAVIAFLPRDVYTSVFVANDAMLVFAVTLCVWIYVEGLARTSRAPDESALRLRWLAALLAAVGLATFTKQHGALAALLPVAWVAWPRPADAPDARVRSWLLLGLGLLLIASEPIYQYARTGHWMVSNQHYFDWPKVQQPGSIAATVFWDFRLLSLLHAPTLGDPTIDSFWTQLFARLWFDYEPKFLIDTWASRRLAVGWYVAGLVLCALWVLGLVVACRRWRRHPHLALLALQAGFLAVPLVQTLRLPYFSSMKATFLLPAVGVSALLLSFGAERVWSRPPLRVAVVALCAAPALLFLWECLLIHEQIDQAMLTSMRGGKLWPYPPGWGTR